VEPIQPVASPKLSDILRTVEDCGTSPANADEFLHRLNPLIPPAEVTLANGFAHEFRDGGFLTPGASVKGMPELIVKVQLCSPHDVYCTSAQEAGAL